jgi:hypothetical protein
MLLQEKILKIRINMKSVLIFLSGVISIILLKILPVPESLELGFAFIPIWSFLLSFVLALIYWFVFRYYGQNEFVAKHLFWICIGIVILFNLLMILPLI